MRRFIGLLGLILSLTACGQVEPVLMTVSMPDCTFAGTDSMEEGRARLGLTLNGIGEWGAALVALDRNHTFDDLVAENESSDTLNDLPSWARTVIELRLSEDDAVDGVDVERVLDPGGYAVICVYPAPEGSTYMPVKAITVDED
jgi:hypothetical protein